MDPSFFAVERADRRSDHIAKRAGIDSLDADRVNESTRVLALVQKEEHLPGARDHQCGDRGISLACGNRRENGGAFDDVPALRSPSREASQCAPDCDAARPWPGDLRYVQPSCNAELFVLAREGPLIDLVGRSSHVDIAS